MCHTGLRGSSVTQPATLIEIERKLQALPPEKLDLVLDFVSRLCERIALPGIETMLASERVLGREWLSTEEDEAWADL